MCHILSYLYTITLLTFFSGVPFSSLGPRKSPPSFRKWAKPFFSINLSCSFLLQLPSLLTGLIHPCCPLYQTVSALRSRSLFCSLFVSLVLSTVSGKTYVFNQYLLSNLVRGLWKSRTRGSNLFSHKSVTVSPKVMLWDESAPSTHWKMLCWLTEAEWKGWHVLPGEEGTWKMGWEREWDLLFC